MKERTSLLTTTVRQRYRNSYIMADGTRKFALVGPSFFSYIEAIRRKFSDRGFEAVFFDERHANTIAVKILYRIGFYSIFEGRKNRHLDNIAQQVLSNGFTDVLLIDVEVCNRRFVERIQAAGVRVHIYQWDSADNKPSFLKYLDLLDGKSSFDPVDCERHGLVYIPLFGEDVFCARKHAVKVVKPSIDVSFCGTLHSNRAQRLRELKHLAHRKGLSVSLLLYFHSRWLLSIKSVVDFNNAYFVLSVSTKGYSKQEIFEVFSRSKFVYDLPHPRQQGLTARTFEVLRSGARLITHSAIADKLPVSLASRVIEIQKVSDLMHIDFENLPTTLPLTDEEDYFLSLDRFMDQVFSLMKIGSSHGNTRVDDTLGDNQQIVDFHNEVSF
jgi:hypothetical protein